MTTTDHLPTRPSSRRLSAYANATAYLRPNLPSTAPVNNLTAAAAVLTTSRIRRLTQTRITGSSEWQRLAWHFYDITPELAYVARFEANSISRASLFAARLPDDPQARPEPVTSPSHPAAMAMSDFLGGPANQPQELARIDMQLTISGISYIVRLDDGPSRSWYVLSNEEVTWLGKGWKFRINGEDVVVDSNDCLVTRVWTTHPRNRWEPDSPVRHLLPVLSELEGLTKHVSASIDSRLAGAGLLILPTEMDFPDDPNTPEGLTSFEFALINAMTIPISNRDIAAAHVPLVIKVPGELVDKVQHLTFATPLDEQTKNLRDEAVRRVALGLDIPPEILLGLEDSNHWTSWQIEESSIKLHIEPKLGTICNAGTVGFLHPYLKAMGVEDWDRYVVWYDVTDLKLRPNKSADAKDLHDELLIDDDARRKAAGFDNADAPTKSELARMVARKVVTSQPQILLTPGIDPKLLELAGLEGIQPLPSEGPTSAEVPIDPVTGEPLGVSNQASTAETNNTPTPDTSPTSGATPDSGDPDKMET